MTPRSYLFVPGDRPERFDKALASGAHVVILDLEDAVQPERKEAARSALASWLQQAAAAVMVRVNPEGTPWHEQDCSLLSLPKVRGVMLPKAEDGAAVERVARSLGGGREVVPLVETVAGWSQAGAIARAKGVHRLAFGTIDFMADTGIGGDGEELDAVRTELVLLSRLAGIAPPIDGVSVALDNPAGLEAEVRRSRRFGMGARLCIHPKQVAAVNAGYAPSPQEIDWAQRVVAALDSGPLGAIAVDGKLVDKPVAARARAMLQEGTPTVQGIR